MVRIISFGTEIEASISNGEKIVPEGPAVAAASAELFAQGKIPKHLLLTPEASSKNIEGGSKVVQYLSPKKIKEAVKLAYCDFEATLQHFGLHPIYHGIDFSMSREEAEQNATDTPRYNAMVRAFARCPKAQKRWKATVQARSGEQQALGISTPGYLYYLTAPTRAFQPNFGMAEATFANTVNCWYWFLPVMIAPLIGGPMFNQQLTTPLNMRHVLWSIMAGDRYRFSPFESGWYPKGLSIDEYLKQIDQIPDLITPVDNRKTINEKPDLSELGALSTKLSSVWPPVRVKVGEAGKLLIGEVRAFDSVPYNEGTAISVSLYLLAEIFGESDYHSFDWNTVWKNFDAVSNKGPNAVIEFALPGEPLEFMTALEAARRVYSILAQATQTETGSSLDPILALLDQGQCSANKLVQALQNKRIAEYETELVQFYLSNQSKPIAEWRFEDLA